MAPMSPQKLIRILVCHN